MPLTTADLAGEEMGAERSLALHYAPRDRRPVLGAVWELDGRMRRLFAIRRDATLSQIKLAWWTERLEALASGRSPDEPLLRQLARFAADETAARDLAVLAEAWRELGDSPWGHDELASYARLRGHGLVGSAARALGAAASSAQLMAGEGYALVDLAGMTDAADVRADVLDAARARFDSAGCFTWPRELRPIGMIVELARRDAASLAAAREGSPRRVARMAWHALTGR